MTNGQMKIIVMMELIESQLFGCVSGLLYERKCQWCLVRMVIVKMYLADHRRGPVGDYQGLASFNLAPPPHQATRVPFYCCTAIYDTAMCILYSSATSITVAKIKVK